MVTSVSRFCSHASVSATCGIAVIVIVLNSTVASFRVADEKLTFVTSAVIVNVRLSGVVIGVSVCVPAYSSAGR